MTTRSGVWALLLAAALALLVACEPPAETPPTATVQPTEAARFAPAIAQPPPEQAPLSANRASCSGIRGTAYLSEVERQWFQANCQNRMNCGQIAGTAYVSDDERVWYQANCSGSSQAVQPPSQSSPLPTSAQPRPQPTATTAGPTCVSSSVASSSVGRRVTVCGTVADASYRPDVNGRPTFLNFDRPYPNHTFTALVWGENRGKFPVAPEQQFGVGKRVCVTGLVELYSGKPQIVVSDPGQIRLC
jgi:DNA/RNA endonuclease YhcR with UshA esterase domain